VNYKSKTCNQGEYKLELNFSKKLLLIKRNNDKYKINVTTLIEDVSDKEMVTDFRIACDCLQEGLKINYEFDLSLYKYEFKQHHLIFKNENILMTKAFRFYSDRNEEAIFGKRFEENTVYSYDEIDNLNSEFIKLIHFNNFQDEKYVQNINEYFDTIKKTFINQKYDILRLRGNSLVLNLSFKNVGLKDALIKYNDIAYYLEQSGAYEEAIFILEKIIKEFPNRTVAYINLGDAYWGLGEKEKAKEAYKTYIKQMKASGKENKIPKHILDRTQ